MQAGSGAGPGNKLQAPHLALIEDPARRRTLQARETGAGVWQLDIALQAETETVFFEISSGSFLKKEPKNFY